MKSRERGVIATGFSHPLLEASISWLPPTQLPLCPAPHGLLHSLHLSFLLHQIEDKHLPHQRVGHSVGAWPLLVSLLHV